MITQLAHCQFFCVLGGLTNYPIILISSLFCPIFDHFLKSNFIFLFASEPQKKVSIWIDVARKNVTKSWFVNHN